MNVLYPIGNSDIQLKEKLKAFREETEQILNDLKSIDNIKLNSEKPSKGAIKKIFTLTYSRGGENYTIRFPLISALFQYLEEEENEKPSNVKYVFLYTNQKDTKMNKQDTIFAYEIIKKLLMKLKIPEEQIKGFEITENPTDIVKLKSSFSRLKDEGLQGLKEEEKLLIVIGPGTPQINIRLLLDFYDNKNTKFIYIRKNDSPVNLSFKKELSIRQIKNSVINLIHRYDYRAANLLYDELQDDKEKISLLLRSLSLQTDFNFKEAQESLEKYCDNFEHLPGEIKNLRETLKKINSGDETELLKELFYEFAIRMESKHYLEAIAMLFRIEEALLMREVEKHLNKYSEEEIKISNYSNNFESFWEMLKSKQPDLFDYLSKHSVRTKGSPNRITYKNMLDYFVEQNKKSLDPASQKLFDETKKILDFYKEIENEKRTGATMSLLDLRNKTPYAHGFEGVSEKNLESIALRPDALLELVERAFKVMGIKVFPPNDKEFPFRKINNYLEKELRK